MTLPAFGSSKFLDPTLDFDNFLQSAVPPRFQLPRDKAFAGINQFMSARCKARLVTRRFEIAFSRGNDVMGRSLYLVRSKDGGFYTAIGNGFEKLQSYHTVDPNAARSDAQSGAHVPVIAAALIGNFNASAESGGRHESAPISWNRRV